jgi:hypothetical protein
LAADDPAGALQWIDRALEHLKAERFVSEFRELRFDIRTALGDAGVKENLRLAIESAAPGERKNRLEGRLGTAYSRWSCLADSIACSSDVCFRE